MNDLTTSSDTLSTASREPSQKETGTSQVLLPKALVQRLKEGLKELKKNTGADYGLAHFVGLVLEKHWPTDMEQLPKRLERLKAIKA